MIVMIGERALKQICNDDACLSMCSAPGGDLQTLMDDDMVPYERDAVKFVRQVLEGLLFLHERNMAHLDIKVNEPKPSNVSFVIPFLFLPYFKIDT